MKKLGGLLKANLGDLQKEKKKTNLQDPNCCERKEQEVGTLFIKLSRRNPKGGFEVDVSIVCSGFVCYEVKKGMLNIYYLEFERL